MGLRAVESGVVEASECLRPVGDAVAASRAPSLRVGFILLNKFTLNAFAGFIDALRLAADKGGRSRQIHCSWTVMGLDAGPVTSSCGVSTLPNGPLLDPRGFDYVAVCGGNDFMNPFLPDNLIDYLRAAADRGTVLFGLCTGSFALVRAGLMDGRHACVHWNHGDAFRELFPTIQADTGRIFIDAGDRITCAGSTGAVDLALYLIARHCGAANVRQCVRHMMLRGPRSASFPQPHFYGDLSAVEDVRVLQAVHYMEQSLDDPPGVEVLARHVNLSSRQLERAFRKALGVSPSAFYRRLRLEYSRWLLCYDERSITEVSLDGGFSDSAHFSREFRSAYGCTPREFRRRHMAVKSRPSTVSDLPTLYGAAS